MQDLYPCHVLVRANWGRSDSRSFEDQADEYLQVILLGCLSAMNKVRCKGRNLFVGHAGHAYCLDKNSGEIVWENSLPKMGYYPVLLAMEGAQAASTGGVPAAMEQQRRQAAAGGAAST